MPFRHDYIRPLLTFRDTWKGVAYEFDDKKLEKSKQEFIDKLKEYVSLVAGEFNTELQESSLSSCESI